MSAAQTARVSELPHRPSPRNVVDAYRQGHEDGERGAKHNHFIGGVSVGVILSGAIVLIGILTGLVR